MMKKAKSAKPEMGTYLVRFPAEKFVFKFAAKSYRQQHPKQLVEKGHPGYKPGYNTFRTNAYGDGIATVTNVLVNGGFREHTKKWVGEGDERKRVHKTLADYRDEGVEVEFEQPAVYYGEKPVRKRPYREMMEELALQDGDISKREQKISIAKKRLAHYYAWKNSDRDGRSYQAVFDEEMSRLGKRKVREIFGEYSYYFEPDGRIKTKHLVIKPMEKSTDEIMTDIAHAQADEYVKDPDYTGTYLEARDGALSVLRKLTDADLRELSGLYSK
jgi:hypothetical protein